MKVGWEGSEGVRVSIDYGWRYDGGLDGLVVAVLVTWVRRVLIVE